MNLVKTISEGSKDLIFEYFAIKQSDGVISLGDVFSAIKSRSRIGECDGRSFLFTYSEAVDTTRWYVETVRLRRACYPILVDNTGSEVDVNTIEKGYWLGEKGAFLCSPEKSALVMLQNKHGVRSTNVGMHLSEIAKDISGGSFTGAIRLIGLSRSIGAAANEMVGSVDFGFYTSGLFNPEGCDVYDDESATWMSGQLNRKEHGAIDNLVKVNLIPKMYTVTDGRPSMINRLPGAFHKVAYSAFPVSADQYPDIETNDFNSNALTYTITKPEAELRYMNRDEMKALLCQAWDFSTFKENYLDAKKV